MVDSGVTLERYWCLVEDSGGGEARWGVMVEGGSGSGGSWRVVEGGGGPENVMDRSLVQPCVYNLY